MKPDYTHMTVILDRTGSMESIRDDTIGGFNAFLRDQQSQPGSATLTLVQFDTQDPYEIIHRFRPIQDVPELTRVTFVPRASTPLLDAMGRGINDLEKTIADMKADDRPSQVVFVVITDGQENSSTEFRKDQIAKMIKDRTEKDDWQFVFLSADMDAISDAGDYGIRPDAALLFEKNAKGTQLAWASLSGTISDFRSAKKKKIGFVPDDRKHPDDPQKKRNKGKKQ
jgi:hypothetical protein